MSGSHHSLSIETCLALSLCYANVCWVGCKSGPGRRPAIVLLSTINMKNLITIKRRKGYRGLTPRVLLLLALVLVLCASSWRSRRWSTTRRCYYDFDTGRQDQLLSQLHNIGIFCSFSSFSLHFECPGCYKGALARDVGWDR